MPQDELPSELSGSAFTTADARERGVGRGRLRGSDLDHPYHGVYVPSALSADDVMARCERLLPALAPQHWFSHRTAARIWGVPLEPEYTPGEGLHVISIASRAALRHDGTIGWVTADDALGREVFGILPVVSPAEVWCQLAARSAVVTHQIIAHEWLVAAGDYLVSGKRRPDGRRDPALCTIDDLQAAIDRRGRRRGTAILRSALRDVRRPVDSPYETRLRLGLVAAGLPEPRLQVPVDTAEGVLHADLGYPEVKVLIEYQGDEHRTSRKRWLSDLTRVQLFQDAGYHVVLVGADDLRPDCTALAARIRRLLARETTR